MKYTYQYRLYPTGQQQLTLNLWLRICRYWYNRQLGDRFDWWVEVIYLMGKLLSRG